MSEFENKREAHNFYIRTTKDILGSQVLFFFLLGKKLLMVRIDFLSKSAFRVYFFSTI